MFGPHRGQICETSQWIKYSNNNNNNNNNNKNIVMKQSKGLNDSLNPEHKKTTNRTTMSPITDIDKRRASQIE